MAGHNLDDARVVADLTSDWLGFVMRELGLTAS